MYYALDRQNGTQLGLLCHFAHFLPLLCHGVISSGAGELEIIVEREYENQLNNAYNISEFVRRESVKG